MTAADYPEQLKTLDVTLRNIENVLEADKLRRDKADLEEQASAPDVWDDQARAQEVNSRLSYVSGEISRIERLRSRLDDATLLLELGEAEGDEASIAEVGDEIVAAYAPETSRSIADPFRRTADLIDMLKLRASATPAKSRRSRLFAIPHTA